MNGTNKQKERRKLNRKEGHLEMFGYRKRERECRQIDKEMQQVEKERKKEGCSGQSVLNVENETDVWTCKERLSKVMCKKYFNTFYSRDKAKRGEM